jgi:hypothetical protein
MHENFSNAIENWEIGELKKQDIRNFMIFRHDKSLVYADPFLLHETLSHILCFLHLISEPLVCLITTV